MSNTNFQPGDVLEWRDRIVPGGQITKRMVSFRKYQNHQCIVSWNLTSDGRGEEQWFTVPPENLSKPIPPALTPAVLPRLAPPSIPLSERRQSLAQAFAGYRKAAETVENSQYLLDRAWLRIEQVQAHLREFADLERDAVDAVLHDLRHMNGHGGSTTMLSSDEDDIRWAKRGRAQREAQAAEAAYEVLVRDLSDAKSIARDRLEVVQKAAAFVLAKIVESEIERLAELEASAAQLRARLRAASMLWIGDGPLQLHEVAGTVLNNPPFDLQDPIGQRIEFTEKRQQSYVALLNKLVAGEVDADLE